MQTYEPFPGEDVSTTAERMVAMATDMQTTVKASFNDIPLEATAASTKDSIVTAYGNEMDRRHKEYIASDEYKLAEEERKRKDEQSRIDLENALRDAPPMTVIDEKKWADAKQKNSDPYGGAVMQYAERWARIMESRINAGQSLSDCADETSNIADSEGLTGFMYGCAVSTISEHWKYGEDLRRWHNKDSQIGTEGDEANESGGVLNPALLTIR